MAVVAVLFVRHVRAQSVEQSNPFFKLDSSGGAVEYLSCQLDSLNHALTKPAPWVCGPAQRAQRSLTPLHAVLGIPGGERTVPARPLCALLQTAWGSRKWKF